MNWNFFNFIVFLLLQKRVCFETDLNFKSNFEGTFLPLFDSPRPYVTVSLFTSNVKNSKLGKTIEEDLCLIFVFLRILNYFDRSIRIKKQKVKGVLMYNFSFSVNSLFGFCYYILLTYFLIEANSNIICKSYETNNKRVLSLSLRNFADAFSLPLFIKGQFHGFLKIDFSISKNENFVFIFDLES